MSRSQWSAEQRMDNLERATAPAIGGVLTVGLTVLLATAAGTALLAGGSVPSHHQTTVIELSVDGDTLTFDHRQGDALDVESLSMRISVDGEPLAEQPPLPFFAAAGFESGPTGPFNTASDDEWSVGETASLTVAGTNSPSIEPSSTVSVRITTDDGTVLRTETMV